MKFRIENIWTWVEATPKEEYWLDTLLSFEDVTARHKQRRGADVDDYIRMYNRVLCGFPTGLVPIAVKSAQNRNDIEIELDDTRTPPCEVFPHTDLPWMDRDYQVNAVDAILRRKRGFIKAVTGAGKTRLSMGTISRVPCKWLFLVHKKDLLAQTIRVYEEIFAGEKCGRIGGGRKWTVGDQLTVGTYQTFDAALRGKNVQKRGEAQRILQSFGGVFGDEAHTAAAAQASTVLHQMTNAYYRVGLSATPLSRTDRRNVVSVGHFGPVICEVQAQELIERGLLAKTTIHMHVVEQEPSDAEEWQGVYAQRVVHSKKRNAKIVEATCGSEHPTLVFVNHVKHGIILRDMLREAGLNVELAWGKLSASQRKETADRLMKEDLDAVVVSPIWIEGVDLPGLKTGVVASGGRSTIQTLQRIGRAMRATETKKTCTIHDILDQGDGWLHNQARLRRKAYEGEGHPVVLRHEDLNEEFAI